MRQKETILTRTPSLRIRTSRMHEPEHAERTVAGLSAADVYAHHARGRTYIDQLTQCSEARICRPTELTGSCSASIRRSLVLWIASAWK